MFGSRTQLPIISYLLAPVRTEGADVTKFNPSVRKVPFFLLVLGLYVQRAIALDQTLRSIAWATLLHSHTRTHTQTHTYTALTEPASSLQQAPTSKLSPPPAVTSWITMATLTPPQSGAELTCLATYISQHSLLPSHWILTSQSHRFCFLKINRRNNTHKNWKSWSSLTPSSLLTDDTSEGAISLLKTAPHVKGFLCSLCGLVWKQHTKSLLHNALHHCLKLPCGSVPVSPLPQLFRKQSQLPPPFCLLWPGVNRQWSGGPVPV